MIDAPLTFWEDVVQYPRGAESCWRFLSEVHVVCFVICTNERSPEKKVPARAMPATAPVRRCHPTVLKWAPEAVQASRACALAAVRKDGNALEFASAERRADREVLPFAKINELRKIVQKCYRELNNSLASIFLFFTPVRRNFCRIK